MFYRIETLPGCPSRTIAEFDEKKTNIRVVIGRHYSLARLDLEDRPLTRPETVRAASRERLLQREMMPALKILKTDAHSLIPLPGARMNKSITEGEFRMFLRRLLMAAAFVAMSAAVTAPVHAQTQSQCTKSQDATVQCFANYALKTGIFTLHYGMTQTQFDGYGIAVSHLIQTPETNLVVFGMASAVADAMPPTNADGTPNQAAQTNAMNSIVVSELTSNVITLPAETSQQQLQWFSLDMLSCLNPNGGLLMSPGTLLRIIDSYVVAQSPFGSVNWSAVNTNLAAMVTSLSTLGMLKLPSTMTTAQVITFTQSLAVIIYDYKVATNRKTL